MPELFKVHAPDAALERLLSQWSPQTRSERIATARALGRVIASVVVSPQDLPEFRRSAVDGFAVIAADTFGASPGLPAFLAVAGEVAMGRAATQPVRTGEAILVHTGGMVPPGADAVVMVENTQRVDASSIEVLKPVAEGEAVIQIGEDVRHGEPLFAPGHRVRPQDIGGLLALGVTEIAVAVEPRVAILSTGDEVVPPHQRPGPGQVRDVNTYTLAAAVEEAGGKPLTFPIVPDDRAALEAMASAAFMQADILVFSAGSSVSYRDMTSEVIAGLGAPGVLVHGVSLKPGKPTILAVCEGKAVFGLPGNPVSALVVFGLFVEPALGLLLGRPPRRRTIVRARLARNLASLAGREDHVAVRLEERDGENWAVPVLGKSNLIYTLVHAEGTVRVPLDSNGVAAGDWVEVTL